MVDNVFLVSCLCGVGENDPRGESPNPHVDAPDLQNHLHQALLILLKCIPPRISQPEHRMRLSVHKLLHDPGCTRQPQACSYAIERLPAVSPVWRIKKRKSALPGDVEVCHDHEPRWFVDQAVDSSDGMEVFAGMILTVCGR